MSIHSDPAEEAEQGRPFRPAADVDRMIAWLDANRDEIRQMRFGRVVFDLHGALLRVRIERSENLAPD